MQVDPNNTILCVTHNDLDGIFSGMLVKHKYPKAYIFPTNYGKDFDRSKLGDVTFVTDFSFDSIDTLISLSEQTRLVWIDHHAIVDQAASRNFNPEGLRRRDVSAAKLVWEYLHPGEQCPIAVQYVSDYDTWVWDKNINALYFHYGMETLDMRPMDNKSMKTFERLLTDNDYVDRIVQVGKKIYEYNNKHNEIICSDGCFETTLDGIRALACNIKNVNSLLFASVDDKYKDFPLRILFSYFANIKKYRVSVFSMDANVVQAHTICARYGGGGHPAAAGFASESLPFNLPVPTKEAPSFENIFRPLQEATVDDPVIRRCANTGNVPLVWSHQYASVLGDYTTVNINHPSASVDAYYSTGLSNLYELGVFLSITNSGWYRYRIYLLDPRLNLEEVCNNLNKNVAKNGRTEFKIVGNSIWCYMTTSPVFSW